MRQKCPNCGNDIQKLSVNGRIMVGCLFCIQNRHQDLINLEKCPNCKVYYCKLNNLCNCGASNTESNQSLNE